jgi:copper chaperone
MIAFEVKDMTCGHCASTITKAVKQVDRQAQIQVDLGRHVVEIAPTEASVDELRDAIAEAGYTPVPLAAPLASERPAGARGGCCGSCH